MSDLPKRTFTLLDAMVLIAATAIGLGMAKFEVAIYLQKWQAEMPFSAAVGKIIGSVLLVWTLAALALRLRPPRPRWRHLVCQPGLLASLAAAVSLVFWAVSCAHLFYPKWAQYPPSERVYFGLFGIAQPDRIAISVATAWMVLAVSGRWRPEASWSDRLGCLLGVSWILLFGYYALRGEGWV